MSLNVISDLGTEIAWNLFSQSTLHSFETNRVARSGEHAQPAEHCGARKRLPLEPIVISARSRRRG